MSRMLRKAGAALSVGRDRLKLDEATTGSLTPEVGAEENHLATMRAGRGGTVNPDSRPGECHESVDLLFLGSLPHGAVLRGAAGLLRTRNRTRSSSRRRQSIRLHIMQNRTVEAEDIFRAGIRGRNRVADDWIETETAFVLFDVGQLLLGDLRRGTTVAFGSLRLVYVKLGHGRSDAPV